MKAFFKFLGILLALIIVGISIFLWTFDLNSYRGLVTEKLSETLGHPVSIDRLEMKLSLIPTVKVSSVRIENPENIQSDKPLFLSTSAEITVALAPLLSHRLEVQKINFGTSLINLVSQNGQNNWETAADKKTAQRRDRESEKSSWLTDMRFDDIAFDKTTFIFNSETKHLDAELTDISIKQLKLFTFTLRHNNQTYKVSGNGNDILQLLSGVPNYVFNLEVVHPTLTIKLKGNIEDTKKFQKMVFNLSASGSNIKECFKQFKVHTASVPDVGFDVQAIFQGSLNTLDIVKLNIGLGGEKLTFTSGGTLGSLTQSPDISLSGTMTLSDAKLAQSWGIKPFSADFDFSANSDKINLKTMTFQAGRSDIKLNSEITHFMTRPQVNMTIKSEYLNTEDIIFRPESYHVAIPTIPQDRRARKISDSDWDVSFLKNFDATVNFDLPHLKIGDSMDDSMGFSGRATLKDGQLKTESVKGTILGGSFSSDLNMTLSEGIPDYKLQFLASELNLNQIKALHSALDGGLVNVSFDGTSSGDSIYTVLSNLNGQAVIELSEGTIISDWFNSIPVVEAMARRRTSAVTFSNSDKITQILCGAAKIDIKDGIMTSLNNIALETSNLDFQMGGALNLTDESMNLKIKPILNTDDEKISALLTVTQLVNITGTLSQPQLTLDRENVVNRLDILTKTSAFEPYTLCQQILTHPTMAQKKAEAQQRTVLSFPKEEKAPEKEPEPQDPLRQQLMETLQDALKQ